MEVLLLSLIVGSLKLLVPVYGNGNIPAEYLHFDNLEAIKSYFRKDFHPLSKKILETFENDCLYKDDPGILFSMRKPFIVIEGNHRSSREIIGKRLAQKLVASYLNNMAPCLEQYFSQMSPGSVTRQVFYLLSVYASVFNAKRNLDLNQTVILNGYWWEQVTFSLIQALKGAPLPPVTNHIFQYPPDLLQPDLIVYVDHPEKAFFQKNRSVELYRELSTRYPIKIQSMTKIASVAVNEVYLNIQQNLSARLGLQHKAHRRPTCDDNLLADFFHFPNLDAIKSYFRNDTHPLSARILETFEKDCIYMQDPGLPAGRRKPFIVIEGNHRSSRDVIGMKLSRRLNGRYLNNLAPCLHDYFKQMPQGTITRRVFYLLSVYASVFNAKIHLNLNRAVILNGYWWEQVTFSLLQALKGAPIPPIATDVFQYPLDLLQPDLIVYVDHPGQLSLQKRRCFLLCRSVELYQMLSARYPIMIVPMTMGLRQAVDEVYLSIRGNLSDHLDFRYKVDPYYEQ